MGQMGSDTPVLIAEHSDKLNPLQRRARSWRFLRRRHNYSSEHVTSQQQQDNDSGDVPMDVQARYAPYAVPPHHQRSSFQKQDQMHIKMETKQKPPERKMERNRQDETLGSWFKIIIPFGVKYDEKWLLNLIQKQCSVSFIPVEFHYEKMQAQFFVENASIACALKNVNGKIFNEDNEKIFIFVEPCDAPPSVQKALKSEKVEQMKLSSLDQSNKKPYMVHSLSTIMDNASHTKNLNLSNTEVKSAGEMDKGQQLEPQGMWVDRNAMCTTSPDKSTNISTILELFPRLLSLDGQETPSGLKCAIEVPKCLPTCKGSFFGSDELKSLIMQFLQQYYLIHDYGDRQGLLCAYHEEACFSLTIPFHLKDPGPSSMCAYFKNSRNMKKLKDPNLRFQLLKHTKCDIVHALCGLPKTQHDFRSFMVDMWFQTESMLCFSVNGVFKEVEGRSPGCVRAFTRTFITTPATPSSFCIVNDKLFVSDFSPKKTEPVLFIPKPEPSVNSMPTFSLEQQEIVQDFSIQSGMNFQQSQK
ncbi:nuclear RNA export factor 3-like isoform X1 [Cervus elaphus]|uniref:nuclear RNA export factor 3 isoform X1 n=1 Tax=Cervus canadensis TaxID=1574408 RepID=UPI001CA36B6C|nr:nuclear RNA export factor 3 isoform X1 [Cervus canadensis]XP_043752400.1 nuclear RNA export factor 3-like isoform X1 [Cervus elaphus]